MLAALTGHRRTAAVLAALPVGIVAFFRDPERSADTVPVADDLVLAPADGKVMHAGPGQDGVAPPGDWQQISIFLSVFDVHINRTPYSGTVTDVTYRPGKWHAAYKFESAFENERSDITLEHTVGDRKRTVIFRQIVGLVARRVVTRVRSGDTIRTGDRIGLMKFGSRMDVFLPPEVSLSVKKGDRTVAGETVLGRWPVS
ncbi:MAG: Phosphatidylserine decarboxylase [Marmoricola sp.]|nr:Phosphatidylserine decarboxylase [Marmoricola sp.]